MSGPARLGGRLHGREQQMGKILDSHPNIKAFIEKYLKDNVGMLASVVAWTLLTSIAPIVAGLVAISGLLLRSQSAQQQVVNHLTQALAGALTQKDVESLVHVATQHTGLLGIIGFLGILWGGSNVGGAISTVFQPIFQTGGRNFIKEKLIDIGMIFVFTALMLIILVTTTAGSIITRLFPSTPVSGALTFIVGTLISLLAGFLLFSVIYMVFPNANPRLKFNNIWPGAAIAAVLFQILTYIFPLYANFSHFKSYGAVIFPILVLTAWIYFFSMILLIGAEFVSLGVLREAEKKGEPVGPAADGTVPQHTDTTASQGNPPQNAPVGKDRSPNAAKASS